MCDRKEYCFLLGFGGVKTRERKKIVLLWKTKIYIPTKEKEFVLLSFVFSFENNFYCVIMRFRFIRVLGLSDFLSNIFCTILPSPVNISHNERIT
jgi:hypothetical protein